MERIANIFKDKVTSAEEAAKLIKTGMTIGASSFSSIGCPKAIPHELSEKKHATNLTMILGASAAASVDSEMVKAGIISRRFVFMSNKDMRTAINTGEVAYQDMHLSHVPMFLKYGSAPKLDIALVEAAAVTEDGILPSTSIGIMNTVIKMADKVIIEVNENISTDIYGIHDIFDVGSAPNNKIIPITEPMQHVGDLLIECPKEKIAAIVVTNEPEVATTFKPVTESTAKVGANVVKFLKSEVAAGRMPKNLLPLQSGVGNVGNAILAGLETSGFDGLHMYTEVMQDAVLELIEKGVVAGVSTASMSLTKEHRAHLYENMDFFRDKLVIRPQEISNHPEVIRRLGCIALNTPLELDIYGHINSTHTNGTHVMNGIGGSGDYARNGSVSIFATESTAKDGAISCIVPMASHIDHTEHDTQIIVTEQGIADLRFLDPTERAECIIENCAHPDYKAKLYDYLHRAQKEVGGHEPQILGEAFSWHQKFKETGSMK